MSTILDALKKVERQRRPTGGALLDVTAIEPKRRRRVSMGVIVACATLGFAAGIGLALWRNTAPVEIAALPDAPPPAEAEPARIAPPPAVAVAPRLEPPAPAPNAASGAVAAPPRGDVVAPSGASDAGRLAAAPRPGDVAPPPATEAQHAPRPPSDAEIAAQQLAAARGVPVDPALGRPSEWPPAKPNAPAGSALEPSPFSPRRDVSPETPRVAAAPVAPPPAAAPAKPPAAAAPPAEPPAEVAALEEPAEEEPFPVEEPPPATPPPADKIIDTGRSPTGQPRVSLSFLQWSEDPARRFAFISIDGGASQRIREGDTMAGLVVAAITPNGVQFRHDTTLFTITPRH